LIEPRYDPEIRLHLFCHALPGHWHLEAATLSAGLSLKWLRDRIFHTESYQELADLAAQAPPGSEGLFFTPYILGERTPHMDPKARGNFLGLTLRHRRAHLVRAVMEGVVFSLRQGLDLMMALGITPRRIVASGGATNHPLWLQLQADIFGRPIYRTTTQEAAALGAALLAGTGIGIYPDIQTACQQIVQFIDEVIYPQPENTSIYAEAYSIFCEIYPAFHKKAVDRT
jgi:xylulokinase